jgi:hypothetical protein
MTDDRTIRIAGEQAEVFNDQMDTDRDLMEAVDDCVAFRPEIDGEWNEHIMLGDTPPRLALRYCNTGKVYPGPYNWTCVLDLGRALYGEKAASGWRMRFQCPEPATAELRAALKDFAIDFAKASFELLRKQNKKAPEKKGFGR